MDELIVSPRLSIPLREIELRASRSSGPGGQHANVTASRIEAVFDVDRVHLTQRPAAAGPASALRPAGHRGRPGRPQPDPQPRAGPAAAASQARGGAARAEATAADPPDGRLAGAPPAAEATQRPAQAPASSSRRRRLNPPPGTGRAAPSHRLRSTRGTAGLGRRPAAASRAGARLRVSRLERRRRSRLDGARRGRRRRSTPRSIASVDPEEFFDFQANRPTITLSEGQTRHIEWPENTLLAARAPGGRARPGPARRHRAEPALAHLLGA